MHEDHPSSVPQVQVHDWMEQRRDAGAQACQWSIQLRALLVEAGMLLPTSFLFLFHYGVAFTLRYLAGVLTILVIQHLFLWAMQRRIRPEPSSLADLLTLARATTGGILAGLIVAGLAARTGVAGWLAWGLALLAATLSDWIDGPLARRFGPTRLGSVLDIEADSWLTLWSAAGAIAWGGLPWWVLFAPLVHYVHPIIALRRGDLPKGKDPWWGQSTGVAQMVLLLAALAPLTGHLRELFFTFATFPLSGAQLLAMSALVFLHLRYKAPSIETGDSSFR